MLFNAAYLFLGLITAACAAPLAADTTGIHARSSSPPPTFNLQVTEAPSQFGHKFKVEFTAPPKTHVISLMPATKDHPAPEDIQDRAVKILTTYFATMDEAKLAELGLPKGAEPDIQSYPFTGLPNPPEVWYKFTEGKDVYTGSINQLNHKKWRIGKPMQVTGECSKNGKEIID